MLDSCQILAVLVCSALFPQFRAQCLLQHEQAELGHQLSFYHRQLRDLQREEQPLEYVNFLSISSVPKKEKVDTTWCPSRKLPLSQSVMLSETNEKTPVIHIGHGAGILHRSM